MSDSRMDEDAPDVDKENDEDLGWQVITGRQSRSGKNSYAANETLGNSQAPGRDAATGHGMGRATTTGTLKNRIVKASRMPQLPEEHRKIIIRQRGGLNMSKMSTTVIGPTVIEASGLTAEQANEDVVCPNLTQNIVVVSAPKPDHEQGLQTCGDLPVTRDVENVGVSPKKARTDMQEEDSDATNRDPPEDHSEMEADDRPFTTVTYKKARPTGIPVIFKLTDPDASFWKVNPNKLASEVVTAAKEKVQSFHVNRDGNFFVRPADPSKCARVLRVAGSPITLLVIRDMHGAKSSMLSGTIQAPELSVVIYPLYGI
ncbi:hypothetical protein HPB50_023350 [Hyalomma asiaticum]|uniref:Uncharacterized protein n=1 Tax=Hyalomma asiaticum TaxID=266040 RepID=A0ACB7TPY0_HYAAI|nr:hypothetical protein HPB50_023350 [Hyalomma asiaticum]